MKYKLKFNLSRSKKVINELMSSFYNKTGIFTENIITPDQNIPSSIKTGSEEHFKFLFYMNSINYGTKMSSLIERGIAMYNENPKLFDAEQIIKYEEETLSSDLRKYLKPRFPNQAIKRWLNNSQLLVNNYQSNVKNVFKGDVKNILNNLSDFYGFGPKISNLLVFFMIEQKLISPKSLDGLMMPIDSHDVNISLWTKIALETNSREDKYFYASQLQKFYTDYCKDNDINILDLDRAMWITGSYGCSKKLCSSCKINSSCSNYNK